MLLQPNVQIHFDSLDVCDAMTHQRTAQHGDIGTRHHQLDHIMRLINTSGRCEIGPDFSMKNSNPMQRQAHISGYAKCEIRCNLHFLQIDVGLIKSIKQHETIHIERVQTGRHVCETAEVRAELDGERDRSRSSNTADDVDVDIFDCTARYLHARGYFVDIQFQRIGPGFSDSPRVAKPAAKRSAIEAGNNWNTDATLGFCDVLKICRGIDAALWRHRFDLFFEERVKNHRSSAGLFHLTDILDLLRKWRS